MAHESQMKDFDTKKNLCLSYTSCWLAVNNLLLGRRVGYAQGLSKISTKSQRSIGLSGQLWICNLQQQMLPGVENTAFIAYTAPSIPSLFYMTIV